MKLFLRLTENVNEQLRKKLRYRGDLSRIVDAALTETNLERVPLIETSPDRLAQIVPRVTSETDKRIRDIANVRGITVSTLANSVLAHWLPRHPD